MAEHNHKTGVWATFNYNPAPTVIATYENLVDLALAHAVGENIVFLPDCMTIDQAIEWWNERKEYYAESRKSS